MAVHRLVSLSMSWRTPYRLSSSAVCREQYWAKFRMPIIGLFSSWATPARSQARAKDLVYAGYPGDLSVGRPGGSSNARSCRKFQLWLFLLYHWWYRLINPGDRIIRVLPGANAQPGFVHRILLRRSPRLSSCPLIILLLPLLWVTIF